MSVKKKTKQTETANKGGFCVYLGPTLTGVIQSGTVYRGSKADVLKEIKYATDRIPLIASLIIPGERLSEDRIKVKTPGNILYENYKKILSARK